EDRVLVGKPAVRNRRRRVQVDPDVWSGRRVVPEGERAEPVQQDRDRLRVGEDARDVGGGREGADLERAAGVALELVAKVVDVDAAVSVLADGHAVPTRLPPGQLVRVVLVRPYEHHRSLPTSERLV